MRVYISRKGTRISHGEKKKMSKYTKKNPPIIAKISCSMRVLDFM